MMWKLRLVGIAAALLFPTVSRTQAWPPDDAPVALTGGVVLDGQQDSLGSIQPGRIADLLVLEADPLQDIRNTRTVLLVVKRGRFYQHGDRNRTAP